MSETIALGDVAQVVAGQHIEASLYNGDAQGTPYLTGPADFGDVTPKITKWTAVPKVLASSGDVLVTVKGAGVGKSNLGCDAAIGRQLMALRPIEGKATQSYLFHFIRSQGDRIARLADGATVPGLGKNDLETLRLPAIPLDEQRRIAAILDKADAVRRKRKRAIELTDALIDAVFHDLFGHLIARPREDQRIRVLGEVAEIASGITKGRKLNGEATREVPYLAVANVQDKFLDLRVVKTIQATESEIGRYLLRKDDLLLTEGGDPDKLGRGTLWADELKESIHQNHIFRVRVTSNELLPVYLIWLLGSRFGKSYFLRSAKQTTGIASINRTQLSEFPVMIPPIGAQRSFEEKVRLITRASKANDSYGVRIDNLFASLQHRAFSGQL